MKELNFEIITNEDWQKSNDLKIIFNQSSRLLSDKLNQFNVSVGDITESARGILVDKSDYSAVVLGDEYKAVLNGKLDRYVTEDSFEFVKYGDNLRERPSSFDIFVGNRILVRRIISRQFRIMASIAVNDFVTKKDIYIFKLKNEDFSIQYILSIINSKLISYLKTKSSTTAKKDDFTQLTLSDIRQIKIPQIDAKAQKPSILTCINSFSILESICSSTF